MKIIQCIAAAMICLVFGSANAQFSGTVMDRETEEPVPFASVVLVDFQIGVVTDENGKFDFTHELPEQFQLKVSASGYETVLLTLNPDEKDLVIRVEHRHLELDEVSVSTPRSGLQRRNATYVESRSMDQLNEIVGTSTGELLQRIPGVYNAASGNGVSKPVVRGMSGIRVVSLLNGIRLENQQWGGDHDIGITSLGIGSVEVIKGPSSLLYGADALGGVIYFEDEPYAKQGSFNVKTGSTFESNTMGSNSFAQVKVSGKSLRFNAAGNYINHADYQVPDGNYVENSRFNGYTGKFALGANRKQWVTHLRYVYSRQYVGIIGEHHHEDGEEEEEHEEFSIDTQARGIVAPFQRYENHLASWENKWFRKRSEIRLLLGYGFNRLAEHEDNPDTAAMQLNLHTGSYALRYKATVNERLELVAGLRGAVQTNRNTGTEEELIPNTRQLDDGVYLIAYGKWDKWSLQGGGRYDFRYLEAGEQEDSLFFRKNTSALNFALGTVRDAKKNTFRVNLSSGFRIPHVSELLTDGEHHGALRYEIGNRDLKSERAIQLDISDELHGEHIELVVNPFVSWIQDFIYLRGTDSVINELPVYVYDQLPTAWFAGVDLAGHYHPHFAHWLHWIPAFSFLYAQDQHGAAIPFIPQARITNEVKFTFGWKANREAMNLVLQDGFYFDQYRISNLETPGKRYHVLNVGLNGSFFQQDMLTIGLGVKNVFNTQYIDHLSRLKQNGIPAPGRNIYVRFALQLEGKMRKK